MTVTETRSTCPYCGVGCGVIIESARPEGRESGIAGAGPVITGVRGDPDHPANFGRLCTKGSTLHLTATPVVLQGARALYPEMRTQRDLAPSRSGWDETLDYLAGQFAATLSEHGPDSVGFYISGQLLTEDYYLFNKLAKGLIGTNNIDTNSRLCMSSAVAGYKQTLGADAPPACYEDIDLADLIFIVGSNTAYAHPILYRRIEDARKRNPALKVIVADPRRTDTAREADLFLPILPGTDVALFNGMLHICMWEDWIDPAYIAAHTDGYSELKQVLRDYTPRFVAETCGISEQDLQTAARWFGQSGAALSLYCQGLNQSTSGTAKNAALINLHLATHQIGKPGAGPFSLTGQPNAMGGREVGGMANLLSAHRDLGNPAHRAEVAAMWGVDSVPSTPGKTAVEMFDALRSGDIKIVWIVCTNPAQSMPDQSLIREALRTAQLVIVQDAFNGTATAAYADVLLPASTWGEKEGTVTNSERRISRVRAVMPPPGEARHDADIAIAFARRLEALLRPGAASLFPYENVEQVWNEHRESTRGRDLDITGLTWDLLDAQGPQQWPYPAGASGGRLRLYEDGVFPTPSGKARFVATRYRPVAEPVDARFPFRLVTGRLRDQWHGMSRSGTVPQLFAHATEPVLQMAQSDIDRRLLKPGDLVHVTSRRGSQILPVQASDELRAGQSFIAMHWGSEFLSGRGQGGAGSHGVNGLTVPAFDPDSKQPELKHAAVKILKAELPWRFLVFGWLAPEEVFGVRHQLRAAMSRFTFASCVPFGRDGRHGLLLRAANEDAVDASLLRDIESLFGIGLDPAATLRYDDARRGQTRHITMRDGQLRAVSLAGDVTAEAWLKDYLESAQPVAALGRLLLMPSARAPAGFKPRGRVVCSCLNVSEAEIADVLHSPAARPLLPLARLELLQGRLKCGTNCGSCLPELKQLCLTGTPAEVAA